MSDDIRRILSVLRLAERLKSELRHSWLSSGRRESVAEHTWQMTLMAVLMHRKLEHPVDLERTLAMITVHDLVEAIAGDVPFFETGERKAMKRRRELEAVEEIRTMLPSDMGELVAGLWHEFEDRTTVETKFAVALDNLEVQFQHNQADLATWLPLEHELVYTKMDGPCAHDRFLGAFCEAVKAESEAKLRAGGLTRMRSRRRSGPDEPHPGGSVPNRAPVAFQNPARRSARMAAKPPARPPRVAGQVC